MPRRKPPFTAADDDEERDRDVDEEDDDESEAEEDGDGEDRDELDDEAEELDEEIDLDERSTAPRDAPSARAPNRDDNGSGSRVRRRARGAGGMGRPSTGPAPRPSRAPISGADVSATAAASEPETELAPDISAWPGTTEASRIAGRHVSTIKLWRAQGRIRALQDGSGCWRYHPDDLAESLETPDQTDPGSVFASGMTAIVQQGANANQRLLAMTELATDGLKDATKVLSLELERAYAKIAELEDKLSEAKDKLSATRAEDLKHERHMARLGQKHELELAGAKETSARLDGLLTIIGPIAASIAARLIGNVMAAEKAEAKAAGVSATSAEGTRVSAVGSQPEFESEPKPETRHPKPPAQEDRLVPLETRITDAMSRLCISIRGLDGPAFQGFRAMMPITVQQALDDIMDGKTDSAVGQALATLIKAAQGLSDLQFRAIRPIAPADIADILAELRELIRVKSDEAPS